LRAARRSVRFGRRDQSVINGHVAVAVAVAVNVNG
jgi:hypothetical protein